MPGSIGFGLLIRIFVWSFLVYLPTTMCIKQRKGDWRGPSEDFHGHDVTVPYVLRDKTKRDLRSQIAKHGHFDDMTLTLDAFGRQFLLDLYRNRDLFSNSYFEKHHDNGQIVIDRPHETEREKTHCYYQGRIRDVIGSWVAISTCNGISGVIYDGAEMHYIEPVPRGETQATNSKLPSPILANKSADRDKNSHHLDFDEDSPFDHQHYVYKQSDLKSSNQTCGFSGDSSDGHSPDSILGTLNRLRRRAALWIPSGPTGIPLRGPWNSNRRSRYVELVLVNDNKEYREMKNNKEAVFARSKEIANIANALYAPLNLFIALVGVVVWSEYDEITLSNDGDATLTNFLHYRRESLVQEHPNDNAQLITGIVFDGGVVGKALKGPICTYEYSGGVNMDHSHIVGLVATTVSHELGHNFGMEHDGEECMCPDDRCIMAPSSSSTSPIHWSSCSIEYLNLAFEHGMDYCLRNKPSKVVGPVCGNGFLEQGEQCDCGLKKFCTNPCCNATSCTLYANATCATGECCDTATCQLKGVASMCRQAESECDLPEYCSGESEFCPDNVNKQDGTWCKNGRSYCFKGTCRSHSDQCKLLWGQSGQMSDSRCFDQNRKGTANGNCGYFRVNQTYKACRPEDILCGMLHCTHLNERLEFGMESVAILSRSFITTGGKILACRSAIVDLGLNSVDPGLAPDGAKCGENKVCVNQRCMPVAALKRAGMMCLDGCNGRGVCNSKGHCHCDVGYSPPLCSTPGHGGSIDSGPAANPNSPNYFAIILYIFFLGFIPMGAMLTAVYYYFRGKIKLWWLQKARKAAIKSRAKDAIQRRTVSLTVNNSNHRPPSKFFNHSGDTRNLDISHPMSPTPNGDLKSPVSPVLSSGNSTLARKAAKLNMDKSSIRCLEISYPMPLANNNVETVLKPVRPAPPRPLSPLDGITPSRTAPEVPGLKRSSSMRTSTRSEGSVRLKRSNSQRPTSPPPRPPAPKSPPLTQTTCFGDEYKQTHLYDPPYSVVYDDCQIVDSKNRDKLGLIDEDREMQQSAVPKPNHIYSAPLTPLQKLNLNNVKNDGVSKLKPTSAITNSVRSNLSVLTNAVASAMPAKTSTNNSRSMSGDNCELSDLNRHSSDGSDSSGRSSTKSFSGLLGRGESSSNATSNLVSALAKRFESENGGKRSEKPFSPFPSWDAIRAGKLMTSSSSGNKMNENGGKT